MSGRFRRKTRYAPRAKQSSLQHPLYHPLHHPPTTLPQSSLQYPPTTLTIQIDQNTLTVPTQVPQMTQVPQITQVHTLDDTSIIDSFIRHAQSIQDEHAALRKERADLLEYKAKVLQQARELKWTGSESDLFALGSHKVSSSSSSSSSSLPVCKTLPEWKDEAKLVLEFAHQNIKRLENAPRVQRGSPIDKLPVSNIIKRDAIRLLANLTAPKLKDAVGKLIEVLMAEWDEWIVMVKNRNTRKDIPAKRVRTELNYSAGVYKLSALSHALGHIQGAAEMVALCL